MNLKPIAKIVWSWTKRNATKLLAAGAIAAEAAGFVIMHKKAPVVKEKLDALPEDATVMDKVKIAAPIYIPAAAAFLLSSGCIVGGCALGEHKAAVLASLYTMSEATNAKLESAIASKITDDKKIKEIHDAVADELVKENPPVPSKVVCTGYGTTLFYIPEINGYFRSDMAVVKNQCADFKNYVVENCFADFQDWLDHICYGKAGFAEFFGWNIDSNLNVYFDESSSPDGELCWVIRHLNKPVQYNGKPAKPFRTCEDCYPD